jgi:hypothetical protein
MRKMKNKLSSNFPSLYRHDNYDVLKHNFSQDMSSGTVPYSRGVPSDKFKFVIKGKDIVKAEVLLKSLARHELRYSHTELLSDVINNLLHSLLYWGVCFYQIQTDDENDFTLFPVTEKRLFNLFRYYFQIVPNKDVHLFEKRILVASRNKIWKLSLPHSLGGSWRFKFDFFVLRLAGKVSPDFAFARIGRNDSSFDLKQYSKIKTFFVSTVLKRFEYKYRPFLNEYISEYYLVHRYLKNKKIKSILRIHVLSELNFLLRKVGFDAVIEETGLPVPDDYERVLSDICEQKTSLSSGIKFNNENFG